MASIYEVVSESFWPHVFTVVGGDSVRVNYQDCLKPIQKKLKDSGLTNVKVRFFDGKREFSAEELKSLIVVGNHTDMNLVFRTLDTFHSQQTFTRLIYLDSSRRFDEFVCEWARQKGLERKRVRVPWKLGKYAAAILFSKLVGKRSRTKPDVAVAFTNNEVTDQVKKAQKAGIPVLFA